jgi:hypothetical protein
MAITRYEDFLLLAEVVQKDAQGVVSQFSVQVFDSPAGQGEKKEILALPDDLSLRSRRLETHQLTGDIEAQIEFGEILAGLLLPPYARQKFTESLARLQEGEGLRLRLRLADELTDYPWECLYIQDVRGEKTDSSFLALDPRLSIVREQILPTPPDAAGAAGLARVLVAMAAPASYPPLPGLAREQQAIQSALAGLPGVQVKCLPDYAAGGPQPAYGATVSDLGAELMLSEHTDVFHFSGHGAFAKEQAAALGSFVGKGSILLADAANQAIALSADRLAELLRSQGVQLVVLGACETARRDNVHVWSSVASSLLKARIPAVVAMQFKISAPAGVAFSRVLYQALAAGYPLDYAVAVGRMAMRAEGIPDACEWAMPALYLRSGVEIAFKPVEEAAALQKLQQALVQIEHHFTRIEPAGRLVQAKIGEMHQGVVQVDLKVDERIRGEVTGAQVQTMQGGELHVRQQAGAVDGLLIGAEIGALGRAAPPARTGAASPPAPAGESGAAACVHCGSPLEVGARFCGNCGKPVAAGGGFCKQCGAKLPDQAKFCASCGARV